MKHSLVRTGRRASGFLLDSIFRVMRLFRCLAQKFYDAHREIKLEVLFLLLKNIFCVGSFQRSAIKFFCALTNEAI